MRFSLVTHIEASFEALNLEGLNLENVRYLNTYELTEEDKKNRDLDFIGGFELIDKEMRCYVFEGLGGEGKAMDRLYRMNERQHTNDKRFKMLYNPNIRFKHRIYEKFECAIKKIKLRDMELICVRNMKNHLVCKDYPKVEVNLPRTTSKHLSAPTNYAQQLL